MPRSLNDYGIISIPIIFAFVLLIGLTGYAASRSFMGNPNSGQSPSPSVIFTPSPSPTLEPGTCNTDADCPADNICQQVVCKMAPCPDRCFPKPSPSPSPSPSPTPLPSPKASATPAPASGSSGGGNIQTDVGSFKATVVTLPIGVSMFTDTASDTDCTADCPVKPLADYISGAGGMAGIHGTYTCPADYADCASKKNSFDFPVYNSRINRWINEDKLGWGGRSMIYQEAGGAYKYRQDAGRVDGIRGGIVNYPGILNDGHITVEPSGLSAKQSSKGTKGGIGFNDNTIFLVVAYNVDMFDFANVFKSLGAKYALNLDGGGSVALWQGGYRAGPGRQLPNAVVFK